MAKTSSINLRVDPVLKTQVEELYAHFGLSITDVINLTFHKSLMERGLPFDLRITKFNEETERAMEESKQLAKDLKAKKIKGYSSAQEIFDSIGV